jgi:hypothetical protein
VTTITGPLSEFLAGEIPRVAARVHRTHPLVPAEDLEQALWLHAIAHAEKLQGLMGEGQDGAVWGELKRAGGKVVKEDDRYRRACKAAAAGYDVDDEHFYSLGMLRNLLVVYYETGLDTPPQSGLSVTGRKGNGTAEDYYVIMIDIDRGLGKLNTYQRGLIERWFGLPQGDDEEGRWVRQAEASTMGLTLEAFRKRVDRALRALQRKLGGTSPWRSERKPARRPEGYPDVVPAEQNRGGNYFEPDPRMFRERAEVASEKWKGSWPSTPVSVGTWDKD